MIAQRPVSSRIVGKKHSAENHTIKTPLLVTISFFGMTKVTDVLVPALLREH